MILDRTVQRQLLETLAAAYPVQVEIEPLGLDNAIASANLRYLEEHGLVTNMECDVLGAPYQILVSSITARGMDFLADDGGLSAILGVTVVKLHADTLRELIASKIAASTLPPGEKKRLVEALRSLPAEALKHLTKRLLDAALDHVPDAILLLQKWLDPSSL